jgi:hypothetical protein
LPFLMPLCVFAKLHRKSIAAQNGKIVKMGQNQTLSKIKDIFKSSP